MSAPVVTPALVGLVPAATRGLTVEGVDFYRGSHQILDAVGFTARAGSVTGLLGPNGAGKTTTLSIIAGVLPATSGRVEVNGQPISARTRGLIGYSPQGAALYPQLSASDNLAIFASYAGVGRGVRRQAVARALEMAGLADHAKARVATFSGGMRQRLSVAVATLASPQVLLLDEPTVGVDPQARSHLLETISFLATELGTTVVYSSHYMEEIEAICSDVVIIDAGRVIASGSVDEVRKQAPARISFAWPAGTVLGEALQRHLGAGNEPGHCTLEGDDVSTLVIEVAALFREFGAELRDLRVTEASLETVFLSMTGRGLRD